MRKDIFVGSKSRTKKKLEEEPKNEKNSGSIAKRHLLRVLSGIAQGDVFDLESPTNSFEMIIGRSNEATVEIQDSSVSLKHARIFSLDGVYYIEDLKSTNGTIVDGHKISGVTRLSSLSKIQIGKNVLELEI
ncbi:MAG: FHA domain-containing protein [Candidatus Ancillula sp.]|jgi:pSer/pThr/pTyr-binding forkhead associated (FHA) protein|nr:FHA domain-containing protein [Candidatus Ancillula sp.]